HRRASLCAARVPAPPETPPLSLHDALPIWSGGSGPAGGPGLRRGHGPGGRADARSRPTEACMSGERAGIRTLVPRIGESQGRIRSEEHTSELQSRENLVCRLLLEKKKPRKH